MVMGFHTAEVNGHYVTASVGYPGAPSSISMARAGTFTVLAHQQQPSVMHYDNCRNCGAPPSRSFGARCAYCGSCATPLVMQAGNNNTLGARAW
jgi:hypothetical protein